MRKKTPYFSNNTYSIFNFQDTVCSKYATLFYFRLFTSLSAGKFMTGRIILSLNTTIIVQIQEGAKLFAVVEEWTIHGMNYCIQ